MTINPQFLPAEVKPLEQWQQKFLEAADLIRTGGHCKGAVSLGSAHCLVGALNAVRAEPINDWRLRERIGGGGFADWNNAPDRTAAEVIAALTAAALGDAR